ncbi:MAG TPA: tetratricopeptide repeat protein [Thermoguttaceae bacterium]|nr:tetratricopeptide repeat protein [Thermoguttaceae bacterium]
MCLWKYRWVAHASVAIAASIALVPASASAWEAGTTPAAVQSDGPNTVEVVVHDGGANEPAKTAEPSAEERAPSAEQTSDPPAEVAVQTPEGPSETLDESPEGPPADSTAQPTEDPGQSADTTSDQPSTVADQPLKPVPDPRSSGIVPAETASFNGITPGVSTLNELQDAWGPPKEIANRNAQLMHLYSVEPFERVEVSFVKDRVSAIVIRLDRAFPADLVAEKLELSGIQPVLVSDELGHVLGQSFPERGVLFAFEPSETLGTASMKVVQIILEPINSEAFVLRAETHMDSQPDRSIHDLEQAIELDPENARAHWLRARLLAVGGDSQAALEVCAEAIRVRPDDAQYRLTRAQILGQMYRFPEAIAEAEQALSTSATRPHVKAQVVCLLGDLLSSQPEPDYRRAIQYHMEAVKTADPLAVSQHPAVRIAAKEVLIDAHLGAGHDIAWGPWDGKEKAVPRWLDQAATVAKDLANGEGLSVEPQFRVATRALAALVGMRGKLDPGRWAEEALRVGQQLIAATPDSPRQDQIRWNLGMALYDAVQIYQMRGDHEKALTYGKRAIGYLEPGAASAQASLADTYLLGRLHFRLGAIHAVGKQDHAAAIYWFEKAIPVFQESVDHLAQAELGRLGETYVSMGVSFWESQQQDRAVRLTQRGVELMEQAVKGGAMEPSALEIPYTNLATMARHLGKSDEADQYLLEAKKHKQTTLR